MKCNAPILVIDDDEYLREVVCAILESNGFKWLAAENGERGLSLARAQSPALILCDGWMPGMNGVQFVRLLRGAGAIAVTPVIFMSGLPDTHAELTREGISVCFLGKPFTPEELMDAVGRVMNGHRPSPEPLGEVR